MSEPLQQVHIRVNDAATGQPTPVRLRVIDAQGRYHAPLGRLSLFATAPNQDVGGNVLAAGQPWAYIDGACEILLPPGPLQVEIAKGPEYRPVEADVQLPPGKLSLRFEIARWHDARQRGWHSGDTRAHFLPPHAALLEAAAEDLAVVQVLIRPAALRDQAGLELLSIPLLDAFSGQTPCLERPGHIVAVNTENEHPLLGSLGLLHCHRIVHPLTFGGPLGQEDWTLADWCGQCHRKKGLVVWTRTQHETKRFRCGEPLVDLLLGEVDAFEITPDTWPALDLWYDLLNIGRRVPLAGASGKDSNAAALGSVRTYAYLGDEACSLPTWIEALRAGRTVVTSGPFVELRVGDQLPGGPVSIGRTPITLTAQAQSFTPFDRLEVVHDGKVVAGLAPSGQPAMAALALELAAEHSGWVAARCLAGDKVVAHTSPVYLEGTTPSVIPEAARRLLTEVEQMIAWCDIEARCATPAQRERLTSGFKKAREHLHELMH